MKKLVYILFIIIFISSCNSGKKSETEVTNAITVSIVPQKTFVEKIAGDDFKINVLVPPGTTPEAGNLLPSQLKDIANSALWFRIGHIGFEYSWKEKVEQANPKMKVVDLSDGLDLIEEGDKHGDEHSHAGGIDPHIWLSPKLVKKMVKTIYDELVLLQPDKTVEYKTNYLNFIKEIDELDIEISNSLRGFKDRKIIVFHPSLSYFARDYELDQWALESGGKEPAPQHMAKVIDMAKQENINVIYIQSEFDRDNARVLAEEINGQVIQVSPLDSNWADNLRSMTQVFVENFQ